MEIRYKRIIAEEGKKGKDLTRSVRLFLASVDENKQVNLMTAKEFFQSEIQYKSCGYREGQIIRKLLNQFQFNKQVDLNIEMRDLSGFQDKLKALVKAGAKITKRGLTIKE